jgi:dTDP-4-dehydrorhamnose reductase
MKVLIIGSTGMLGKALLKEARSRNYNPIGIARRDADICIDISNDADLKKAVLDVSPDVLINTAANINLEECEKNPSYAYLVNARPSSILSDICFQSGIYYIYISTDHYFTGDKDKKHNENHPIKLLNEYSRSKYIGEVFTLFNLHSLVIRTNIVGFRRRDNQQTFVEWIIKSIRNSLPVTLFEDYYTSSINVTQFASCLYDLINQRPSGILNVASNEVKSKKDFIEAIAFQLGIDLSTAQTGSVFDLHGVRRAESLGLDVSKAEHILGYDLPTFKQVISSIMSDYYESGAQP